MKATPKIPSKWKEQKKKFKKKSYWWILNGDYLEKEKKEKSSMGQLYIQ